MNNLAKKASAPCALRQPLLALGCLLIGAVIVTACSSVTETTGSGMGAVRTMISDPATCSSPNGPFSHVYVTITDVKANVSSTAEDDDSGDNEAGDKGSGNNNGGWVDLTPGLSKSPKQIDLLGLSDSSCFLASLGDAQELPAGTYHQIRLILADNSLSVSGNACGSFANCVMLTSDTSNTPRELLLSSESKTGIKIRLGDDEGFTVPAGKTVDLDIDFMTCESIVREGNGKFRLKPVLHAGEVSTISNSISGRVLDKATGNPVGGAVTVNLERKDAGGIDRIVMSKTAAADGTFAFCPLPAGTYDIVIVGTRTDGVLYEPTIITGVSVGDTTGNIKLHLPATTATSAATLSGLLTSQNAAKAATEADVDLSVLETVSSVTYTIPLPPTSTQSSATLAAATAASTMTLACPMATDCASYKMSVSSGGPFVGAWSAGGATLTQSSPLATYVVDGIASVPSSGGTADCTPSELRSAPASALSGAGPYNVTVPTLPFVSCQ